MRQNLMVYMILTHPYHCSVHPYHCSSKHLNQCCRITVANMATILLPMEHYQMLFNAFFAAAKVNNNAFLKFRCQNNTVRVKWSDTDKPYTTKDVNMPHRGSATFVDVSRPPPTAVQLPVGNRRESDGDHDEARPTADQPTSNSEREISPRMLRKRRKKTPISRRQPG